MWAAATKYGGTETDVEQWAITGLLHDADYEQWPEEHPRRIVDWLGEQGEEEIAYTVSFHQTSWGLPPKTRMDKCLLACRPADLPRLLHRTLLFYCERLLFDPIIHSERSGYVHQDYQQEHHGQG